MSDVEQERTVWCEECTWAALRGANKHPERTGGCDDDQCMGYPPQSRAKDIVNAPQLIATLTARLDLAWRVVEKARELSKRAHSLAKDELDEALENFDKDKVEHE